jgi:fused signal recognition particle receptor
LFESLKKKFSGTVGKISERFSGDDDESLEKEKAPETEIKETQDNIKEKTQIKPDENTEDSTENKPSRFSIFRKKSDDQSEDKKDQKISDDQSEDKSVNEDEPDSEENKPGIFGFATHKTISEKDIDDILFELEISLLEGDVALEVAEKIIKSVETDLVGRKIKRRNDVAEYTKDALKKAISEILIIQSQNVKEMALNSQKSGEPLKIMFVGVNGTGKTTTISKLSDYFISNGLTPVIAASDTFRAGAIEQITYHADKLGVKIIKHQKGADPAAVAYDAVEHAKAQKKEVVLIDTAGRMQTNVNLMDEMKKIQRVVKPDLVIFVGDALTGNDAVEQATKFNDAVGFDGIILTKADADAKGGAALSIGYVVQKPILFLGTGQSYSDLMEFRPEWMVEQVLGE